MNLQRQPTRWSCLPTAFAMVLNLPIEDVILIIGHDGSDILFPNQEEPYCRRSFHIQELIDVSLKHGYSVTEILLNSYLEVMNETVDVQEFGADRIEDYLQNYTGVLIGREGTRIPHAVAWDGIDILDPNGTVYHLDNFNVSVFMLIQKINLTSEKV